MMYEVERRTPGHFILPSESSLIKSAWIRDDYFSVYPTQLRLREIGFVYPKVATKYALTIKRRANGAFQEKESPLTEKEYGELMHKLEEKHGKTVVTVSGYREQYKFGDSTICVDWIGKLGDWSEVEVMVNKKNKIDRALLEIFKVFSLCGKDKENLVDSTYPEILMNMYTNTSINPTQQAAFH